MNSLPDANLKIPHYVTYSFRYALFTPALFSLISPRDHPHLQGKEYGIIEPVDKLASLFAFLLPKVDCDISVLVSNAMLVLAYISFIGVNTLKKT